MYSTPARTGIDPVYVLAPFYFIFFGMMLSDAAYGILLSIGALIVLKVKKPTGMFRQVTGVLAICGVSTLIWGALFGSWFGLEGIQPILFSPLSAPLPMLILCISIGYLHILTALGTGFYMLARDGKIWDAIFDKGFWIITLLAVPALLLDGTAGLICACVGLGGLILTQGRAKKGIVKKLIGGLASVYDITGYLSDLLSYSRIFGMALGDGCHRHGIQPHLRHAGGQCDRLYLRRLPFSPWGMCSISASTLWGPMCIPAACNILNLSTSSLKAAAGRFVPWHTGQKISDLKKMTKRCHCKINKKAFQAKVLGGQWIWNSV